MKTIFVVHSYDFEKIHYMLCMANTAAALDNDVIIFFASDSVRCVFKEKNKNWYSLDTSSGLSAFDTNKSYVSQGIVGFEELLQSAISLKINFYFCSMLDNFVTKNSKFIDGINISGKALSFIYGEKNIRSKIIFI